MKRLFAAFAFTAALATGCAPPQAVYLKNAIPVGKDCKSAAGSGGTSTDGLAQGFLDLALAGPAPVYGARLLADVTLNGKVIQVGNDTLTDPKQQTLVLNEYRLKYSPALGVAEESVPLNIVVAPNSTDNEIPVSLIGPKGSAAAANLVAAGGTPVTLSVTVSVRGNLIGFTGAYGSNEVVYPIYVYRSGCTPAAGQEACAAQDQLINPVTCQ